MNKELIRRMTRAKYTIDLEGMKCCLLTASEEYQGSSPNVQQVFLHFDSGKLGFGWRLKISKIVCLTFGTKIRLDAEKQGEMGENWHFPCFPKNHWNGLKKPIWLPALVAETKLWRVKSLGAKKPHRRPSSVHLKKTHHHRQGSSALFILRWALLMCEKSAVNSCEVRSSGA